MSASKPVVKKPKEPEVIHFCRTCGHCKPVYEPSNLLSLKGEPTLGRCPYWTESRSFLLSQRACSNYK